MHGENTIVDAVVTSAQSHVTPHNILHLKLDKLTFQIGQLYASLDIPFVVICVSRPSTCSLEESSQGEWQSGAKRRQTPSFQL